jgi:catechol 2,3-dioxygenase-like lactoylglutathione lyase family enzyme
MSEEPMIEGISAITLATHDMRRAVRFYRVLGFAMLYGGEDEDFTSFKAGSNFVNLIAQPAGRQWSWWGRVIFYHPDVDGLYARLAAAGYRIEAPLSRRGMGRALLPYYRSRRP